MSIDSFSHSKLLVGLASDSAYTIGLIVTMRSLLGTLDPGVSVSFYILDGGMTSADRKDVLKTVSLAGRDAEVVFLSPSLSELSGVPRGYTGSIMTYARLLLPMLVPGARLLYLDSDIVVQRDMAAVWNLDLQGKPLAAVRDGLTPTVGAEAGASQPQDTRPYFNGGLLLIDRTEWEHQRFTDRALELIRVSEGRLRYWDQTVLNQLFVERWFELDGEYNVFPKVVSREPKRFALDSVNIHFVGGCKPWIFRNDRWICADRYFVWLDKTSRAGWRPRMTAHLIRQIRKKLERALISIDGGGPAQSAAADARRGRRQLRRTSMQPTSKA